MTHRTLTLIPLALALAAAPIVACAPSDATELDERTQAPPEDEVVGQRVVRGHVDDDGPAIEGQARFDSATEAHVVSVKPDGSRESHGSATIEADGSFEVAAEGMTRTFLVEARDAEGRLIAAAIARVDDAEADIVEAGRVTAETSVEAMVWAEIVASAGFEAVTSAEVRSRVDAATAAAIHAWRAGTDSLSAGFDVAASAILAAAHARETAASDRGIEASTDARGRARAHVLDASTTAEFALGLDAALEAEGLDGEARSEIASRAEASLRAAFEAAIAGGDAASEAAAEAASSASATLEARAHAAAWAAVAASGEASTALTVELSASLDALAEARERGMTDVADLRAELDTMVWATAEAALPERIGLELAAELGVGADAAPSAVIEAMVAWIEEIRAGAVADVRASAAASADGDAVDAEAMARASATGWARAAEAIERVADRLEEDSRAHAALTLVASAFLVVD